MLPSKAVVDSPSGGNAEVELAVEVADKVAVAEATLILTSGSI